MFVQGNLAGFLQALLVAGIIGLLFTFNHNAIFESIGVAKSEQFYVLCYFFIALLGISEIMGLKGRVYWLPTWFFIIVLALLGGLRLEGWLVVANAVLVIGMGLSIIKITDRQFIKKFNESKIALKDLEKFTNVSLDKRRDFWQKASQSFIYPSHFFLFFYPIYKIINPGSVKQMDFVQHNLKLISKIETEVTDPKHQQHLKEFKAPLELALIFKKYKHPGYALTNLRKIIKHSLGKTR